MGIKFIPASAAELAERGVPVEQPAVAETPAPDAPAAEAEAPAAEAEAPAAVKAPARKASKKAA
jgi:small subunit ribosomal protein S2